ncbi:MAG: hypothetical protein ABSA13_16890 [Beijerinckiaceae bacterium]
MLTKEERSDQFVTTIRRNKQKALPFGLAYQIVDFLGDDDDYANAYDLEINCSLENTQLIVESIPLNRCLKKFSLLISCAPSLEYCYLFEMAHQYSLKGFGEFDHTGKEVVRRWYRVSWNDGASGLIDKISSSYISLLRSNIDDAIGKIG